MSDRRALVTRTTGQDGSYVAELPLVQGSEVAGIMRPASTESVARVAHLADPITIVRADLLADLSLVRAIAGVAPTEVCDLAAQGSVSRRGVSLF